MHSFSRIFRKEAKRNTLFRLDAEDQKIRARAGCGFHSIFRERRMGRSVELNRYIGYPLRHALAAPNVERNIGPTPVVDENREGRVSIGLRIGTYSFFLPESRHGL